MRSRVGTTVYDRVNFALCHVLVSLMKTLEAMSILHVSDDAVFIVRPLGADITPEDTLFAM